MSNPTYGMSIRDFTKHKPREGGGGRHYLSSKEWKEKGQCIVWLTRAPILSLWRHPFQRIETRENKTTHEKTNEVWGDKLVCYETEDTLSRQSFRDRDTSERETPPEKCPVCLLNEHLRGLVEDGKISWLDPVFRFKGTDESKAVTLYAGGMYGAFSGRGWNMGRYERGKKDLTDEEKAELKKIGVYAKDSFKHTLMAKLEYAIAVVDDGDPKKGVQVSIESQLLGQKIQTAIAKRMEDLGEEEGDPVSHPYAIKWVYNKNAVNFGDTYDAVVLSKIPLRPEVRALLAAEPPDMAPLAQRFNPQTIQARMQKHVNPKISPLIPWKEIFGKVTEADYKDSLAPRSREEVKRTVSVPAAPKKDDDGWSDYDPAAAAAPPARGSAPAAQDETIVCDNPKCAKPIQIDWAACPHCGMKFDADAAEPAPEPPKMRTRAEARAAAAKGGGAPAPRPAPAPAPASEPAAADDWGGDDDGIPFIRLARGDRP